LVVPARHVHVRDDKSETDTALLAVFTVISTMIMTFAEHPVREITAETFAAVQSNDGGDVGAAASRAA